MAQEKWLVDGPKTIDIDSARTLKVGLIGGQVDIVAHDEPGVRVEVHSVSGKDLKVSIDGDTVEIDHPQLSWDNWLDVFTARGPARARADVSVMVPRDIRVKLGVVSASALRQRRDTRTPSLSTVSGDLVIDSVSGDLPLNSVSGEITVRNHDGKHRRPQRQRRHHRRRHAAPLRRRQRQRRRLPRHRRHPRRDHASTPSAARVTMRLDADVPASYALNTVGGKLQLDDSSITGVKGRYTGKCGELDKRWTDLRVNTVGGDVSVLRAVTGMSPAVFAHGHLRLYLLSLLAERSMHGYELIQALSDRFGGTYVPSAGTIYPRLAKLEEEGLVTKEADGRKTVYAITDAGRAELDARAARARRHRDRADRLGAPARRRGARLGHRRDEDPARRPRGRGARRPRRGARRPAVAPRTPNANDVRVQSRARLHEAEAALAEFRADLRADLRMRGRRSGRAAAGGRRTADRRPARRCAATSIAALRALSRTDAHRGRAVELVVVNCTRGQARARVMSADRGRCLPLAGLDEQHPARRQPLRRAGDHPALHVEPVGAAVERDARFVLARLGAASARSRRWARRARWRSGCRPGPADRRQRRVQIAFEHALVIEVAPGDATRRPDRSRRRRPRRPAPRRRARRRRRRRPRTVDDDHARARRAAAPARPAPRCAAAARRPRRRPRPAARGTPPSRRSPRAARPPPGARSSPRAPRRPAGGLLAAAPPRLRRRRTRPPAIVRRGSSEADAEHRRTTSAPIPTAHHRRRVLLTRTILG